MFTLFPFSVRLLKQSSALLQQRAQCGQRIRFDDGIDAPDPNREHFNRFLSEFVDVFSLFLLFSNFLSLCCHSTWWWHGILPGIRINGLTCLCLAYTTMRPLSFSMPKLRAQTLFLFDDDVQIMWICFVCFVVIFSFTVDICSFPISVIIGAQSSWQCDRMFRVCCVCVFLVFVLWWDFEYHFSLIFTFTKFFGIFS